MRATDIITTGTTSNLQARLALFFARPFSRAVLFYSLGILVALLPVSRDGWPTAFHRLLLVSVSVALFFVISLATNHLGLLRWLAGLIVGATIAIAVVGTAQLNTTTLYLTGLSNQVYSTLHNLLPLNGLPTVNKNVLGGFLVTFLPLALAFAFWEKPWWLRLYGLGGAVIIGGAILVTTSRSAQLGLVVIVMVFSFWLAAGHQRLRFALGLFTVLALLGGSAYLALNGLTSFDSGTSRIEVWRSTLAMVADYPFTGIGLGQYPAHFLEYATPFLAGTAQPHAHNIFLQSLAEFGLAGFISVFLMFWTTVRLFTSYNDFRILAAPLRPVVAGSMAGMVVYFASGMLEYGNWDGKFAPAFWILPGLLAAALPQLPAPAANLKLSRLRSRLLEKFKRRAVRLSFIFGVVALLLLLAGPLGLINVATIVRPSHPQTSQALYQVAAAASVWNATPLRDLGKMDLNRNNPTGAEVFLKQAIQRDPDDWLSLMLLAEMADKAGNHTEGLAYWRRAVAGLDFMLLANQELARTPPDYPAAEKYLRLALDINPANSEATSALIKSYSESGNKQEALAMLQRTKSLCPKDAILFWEMGNRYLKNNQPEIAEEFFQQILKLDPTFQPPSRS